MSYAVDTNLLLYASDTASSFHTQALGWLETRFGEPEILYLAWPVAFSYLRIATHPRIFDSPLTPREALTNLQSLKRQPRVRFLEETPDLLDVYSQLTVDLAVRGNLVPDAQLATILYKHGIRRLYSNDSDFRKFDFLDVRDPFAI